MISDDLVNSYHLLLCALDLVFTNALLCNTRKELLNPNFKGSSTTASVTAGGVRQVKSLPAASIFSASV